MGTKIFFGKETRFFDTTHHNLVHFSIFSDQAEMTNKVILLIITQILEYLVCKVADNQEHNDMIVSRIDK